jgi:hypothetical protein
VTDRDVLALIAGSDFHVFAAAGDAAATTICRLRTTCGHVLIGSSTPALPSSFDRAIGERQAFGRAVQALVDLERFHRRRAAEAAP